MKEEWMIDYILSYSDTKTRTQTWPTESQRSTILIQCAFCQKQQIAPHSESLINELHYLIHHIVTRPFPRPSEPGQCGIGPEPREPSEPCQCVLSCNHTKTRTHNRSQTMSVCPLIQSHLNQNPGWSIGTRSVCLTSLIDDVCHVLL